MRLNDIMLTEDISAAAWEKIIAIAWNKKIFPNLGDMAIATKTFGVSGKIKKFPKWVVNNLEIGNKIVEELQKNIGLINQPMLHYGAANISTTDEWLSADKTPKTDLLIGTESSPIVKISLKKSGNSQLMSGAENDILSVTQAALNKMQNTGDILISLKELLEESSTIIPGTITDMKKNGKDTVGYSDIEKLALSHEKLNSIFSNYLKQSPEFATYFVEEALTGNTKFGVTSPGAADTLLVFNPNGSIKVKKIDETLVSKIKDKAQFNFSFKSRKIDKSGNYKVSTSLRVGVKENLSPINKIIIESFELFIENEILNEDISTFIKRVKKFVNSILIKIYNIIKTIAKKGVKALMNFFGLEIENVEVICPVNF